MMLKDESREVRNAATFALEQIVPQTSKETK
jgi:HEAT repeat protein